MFIAVDQPTLTLKYGKKELKLSKQSEFIVQVGFLSKGRYHDKYSFNVDNWYRAIFYFSNINIGNGFKKRLVVKEGDKVTKIVSVNS
jgi:hypothetical protein